jgi:hypothetical protein
LAFTINTNTVSVTIVPIIITSRVRTFRWGLLHWRRTRGMVSWVGWVVVSRVRWVVDGVSRVGWVVVSRVGWVVVSRVGWVVVSRVGWVVEGGIGRVEESRVARNLGVWSRREGSGRVSWVDRWIIGTEEARGRCKRRTSGIINMCTWTRWDESRRVTWVGGWIVWSQDILGSRRVWTGIRGIGAGVRGVGSRNVGWVGSGVVRGNNAGCSRI